MCNIKESEHDRKSFPISFYKEHNLRCATFLHNQIKFQLTWLSGCGGGNGVYSFLVFFFLGSLRFFKFFRLNLGKNLSQLCVLSSGSFANSRLIIKVFSGFRTSQRSYEDKQYYSRSQEIQTRSLCDFLRGNMLHSKLPHLASVRAEGLNYEQQNQKEVSKQGQNALEKVLQFKWASIKPRIKGESLYKLFLWFCRCCHNGVMAMYSSKMKFIKVTGFYRAAHYRNPQNRLPHRNM